MYTTDPTSQAPPSSTTTWANVKEKLQCPIDEDGDYVNDRWVNRDLIPIPPERRTYHVWSFAVYWLVSGACISAYSTGSSLLAYGLTAQQAMACVVIGGVITGILSVISGWMGEVHHIGFTVSSRMVWGMKLSYFPVCLRIFTSIWWFGIQAYWGGQAFRVLVGTIISGFFHMKNTLPPSANITTADLIGVILWYICYIPLVMVPPERLQRPFIVSSACFAGCLIGLLVWSVKGAGGAGPLFHTKNTAPNTSYSMMLGITSILSSWGSGTIGQSDWTRYSARRYAPTLSQLVAAPTMIVLTALIGVIVTSASSKVLDGEIIWSPIVLLATIQAHYGNTPAVRAAVFFGALGCCFSQLAINVVLNSVSTGMDAAGLWPRYINIRRGAYMLAIMGLASTPWNILSSAGTFLSVISGLGIFIAPMTGCMLSDYHIIRKRVVSIPDLYIGNTTSIYWFRNGFNWRTVVAWALGSIPPAPGFIMTLRDPKRVNGWTKLFNITFLVGLSIGFVAHTAICYFFPPPYLGIGEDFLDDTKYAKSVLGDRPPGIGNAVRLDEESSSGDNILTSSAGEDSSDLGTYKHEKNLTSSVRAIPVLSDLRYTNRVR